MMRVLLLFAMDAFDMIKRVRLVQAQTECERQGLRLRVKENILDPILSLFLLFLRFFKDMLYA